MVVPSATDNFCDVEFQTIVPFRCRRCGTEYAIELVLSPLRDSDVFPESESEEELEN